MVMQRNGAAARRKEYYQILELLQQKKIPKSYPQADEKQQLPEDSLQIRGQILGLCGYCLLSYDWLEPLAQWIGARKCLEIMCGSGALSKGLQDCGVDIRATDDYSWDKAHSTAWFRNTWTQVEQLTALQAIEQYGGESELILCSWPFVNDDCYEALLKMRQVNPAAQMIFIGEWRGGTASSKFFDAAKMVESDSFAHAVANFKCIYGVQDRPYLVK